MMMMSIFSSFDALLAESLGQKVGLSWAPSKPEKDSSAAIIIDPKGVAPSSIRGLNKGSIGKSSPPSTSTSSSSEANKSQEHQKQKQRRPRFAPELDGVHCFETIIPY